MNTHWKIFNIVNLICLTLIIGFISVNLYFYERPSDYLFYVVIFSIILVVTTNCIHNISLTKLCVTGEKMILGRKILFWILLILFAAIIFFFVYLTYDEIERDLRYNTYGRKVRLKYLLQFLSISVTGLYISGAQVVLFFKTRRSYQSLLSSSVDEIGNQ